MHLFQFLCSLFIFVFHKTLDWRIWCLHQDVSYISLNKLWLLLLPWFMKQCNDDFHIINSLYITWTYLNCCVLLFTSFFPKQSNGELILSTEGKFHLFEWLCLLFISFFHKTMQWLIWCHWKSKLDLTWMVAFVIYMYFLLSQNNVMMIFDIINSL